MIYITSLNILTGELYRDSYSGKRTENCVVLDDVFIYAESSISREYSDKQAFDYFKNMYSYITNVYNQHFPRTS